MISIKLTPNIIKILELAISSTVLREVSSDYLLNDQKLFIPEDRFKDPLKLEEFIKSGQASRI